MNILVEIAHLPHSMISVEYILIFELKNNEYNVYESFIVIYPNTNYIVFKITPFFDIKYLVI